ncbi:MAG TPA: dihydrofolate reductase [Clostridia bacterium]|nr:dihydrofolate reductase [Clostridia bacterium]HQM97115.1 dihydrofolate reductase [Clostridia bacterium]HQO70053.1 dihydrofolate reductase [Clostridia bacterium]
MNLIVAVDENWGIGYLGKIQWNIKEDMAFFRNRTLDKTIIMGRKTLESFKNGKPLKNRFNIVLTKDKGFLKENAIVVHSVEQALERISDTDTNDIYIIGGQSIYEAFLPYCDKAFVTKVHGKFNADKYFTDLDRSEEWKLVHESDRQMTESGLHITFCEYERKNDEER